jgi:hypothetical protein
MVVYKYILVVLERSVKTGKEALATLTRRLADEPLEMTALQRIQIGDEPLDVGVGQLLVGHGRLQLVSIQPAARTRDHRSSSKRRLPKEDCGVGSEPGDHHEPNEEEWRGGQVCHARTGARDGLVRPRLASSPAPRPRLTHVRSSARPRTATTARNKRPFRSSATGPFLRLSPLRVPPLGCALRVRGDLFFRLLHSADGVLRFCNPRLQLAYLGLIPFDRPAGHMETGLAQNERPLLFCIFKIRLESRQVLAQLGTGHPGDVFHSFLPLIGDLGQNVPPAGEP